MFNTLLADHYCNSVIIDKVIRHYYAHFKVFNIHMTLLLG